MQITLWIFDPMLQFCMSSMSWRFVLSSGLTHFWMGNTKCTKALFIWSRVPSAWYSLKYSNPIQCLEFDSVFIWDWKSDLYAHRAWEKMTAKLLKTIYALKFSSKWNYKIYRPPKKWTFRSVKKGLKIITGSLANIKTWTDRASFTERK